MKSQIFKKKLKFVKMFELKKMGIKTKYGFLEVFFIGVTIEGH
jgi:hypothetical protein